MQYDRHWEYTALYPCGTLLYCVFINMWGHVFLHILHLWLATCKKPLAVVFLFSTVFQKQSGTVESGWATANYYASRSTHVLLCAGSFFFFFILSEHASIYYASVCAPWISCFQGYANTQWSAGLAYQNHAIVHSNRGHIVHDTQKLRAFHCVLAIPPCFGTWI